MKLFVDVENKQLLTSINGGRLSNPRFFQGDLLDLKVMLVDGGAPVSSVLLDPGYDMSVTLRVRPISSTAIASTASYTLINEVAYMVLDLTGASITDFLEDFAPQPKTEANITLEVEIVKFDGTKRETLFTGPATLQRDAKATTATPGVTREFNSDFNSDHA